MFTVTPVEAGKEAFNVYAEAGVSIIRGTHRPQDLIPAWMNVIRDSHYFGGLLDSVPHGAIRYTNGEWHIEENHPWFDSEDCNQWFVNDDLWGAMELSAPTGHYFGTLEGDGSDFGFWPYREQE